jgi:hypothetical protein
MGGEGGPYTAQQMGVDIQDAAYGGTAAGTNPYNPDNFLKPNSYDPTGDIIRQGIGALANSFMKPMQPSAGFQTAPQINDNYVSLPLKQAVAQYKAENLGLMSDTTNWKRDLGSNIKQMDFLDTTGYDLEKIKAEEEKKKQEKYKPVIKNEYLSEYLKPTDYLAQYYA